jgi:hypothetical protein
MRAYEGTSLRIGTETQPIHITSMVAGLFIGGVYAFSALLVRLSNNVADCLELSRVNP